MTSHNVYADVKCATHSAVKWEERGIFYLMNGILIQSFNKAIRLNE